MLVSIGSYQICNGTRAGGVAVSDLRLNIDRTFDVVIPLPGLFPIALDRLTSRADITFTVRRMHASLQAAEKFIIELEETLPRTGNITLVAQGGEVRYIKNGAIVAHRLTQQNGSTTFHEYHLSGGPTSATP
jgi:hypothetical protein